MRMAAGKLGGQYVPSGADYTPQYSAAGVVSASRSSGIDPELRAALITLSRSSGAAGTNQLAGVINLVPEPNVRSKMERALWELQR